MNDVVERVARAIDQNAFKAWQSMYDYCLRSGDDEATARRYADSADGPRVERAKAQARAAIEAMREPSHQMLAAVDDEASDKFVARGRAYSAWVSMIDAALADASLDGEPQ